MSATSRRASPPSSEALQAALAGGARGAPWLQRHFGISQPTLSRAMAPAAAALPALRRFGRGKATLYGLTAGAPARDVWFQGSAGTRHPLGQLHALVADEWVFAPAGAGTPALFSGLPPWFAVLQSHGHRLPGRFGVGDFRTEPAASPALPPPDPSAASPAVKERLQDLRVAAELAAVWLRAAGVPSGPVPGWPLAAVEPGLPEAVAAALPKAARRGSLGAGTLQSLRWLVDFAACIGDELVADHLLFAAGGVAAAQPVPPWRGLPGAQWPSWRPRPQAIVAGVAGLWPRSYRPHDDGQLPAAVLEPPAGGVRAARHAAERFWRQLAQEPRVSFAFRLIAAANARRLEPVAAKNRN